MSDLDLCHRINVLEAENEVLRKGIMASCNMKSPLEHVRNNLILIPVEHLAVISTICSSEIYRRVSGDEKP